MTEDELVKLCQRLDRIEAEMRRHENALYSIRAQLRAKVSPHRRDECGFEEPAAEST